MESDPPVMSDAEASPSTELTGGAGYTYEDTVVAYYLAALLCEEGAAGQPGKVVRVAVQQYPQGAPLDDVVVTFSDPTGEHRLDLQVKRSLTISAAESNRDFREVLSNSLETRAKVDFRVNVDRYGFVAETVATGPIRTFRRLLDWARSSPTGAEFASRFEGTGATAAAERTLRAQLRPLLATTDDAEADFYRHFVAPDLAGLESEGALFASITNRLEQALAPGSDATGRALFSALCREARLGAGTGKVWTRPLLLQVLASSFRLRGFPTFADDLAAIRSLADTAIADISDEVGAVHIERSGLIDQVLAQLGKRRFVNITGLPGSGKSAVLRNVAQRMMANGPILFLKSDLLLGTDWHSFAAARRLRHVDPVELLAEMGATGSAVLLIDGIDRIPPPQRAIVKDLLRAMTNSPALANWKVLVTSRDQGLEPFRAWVPPSFYQSTGIGDVSVTHFDDEEAEQLATRLPALRSLLFGSQPVREIARRPFFAAVLARSSGATANETSAKSEIDLIAYWWAGGGYTTDGAILPQRQRALLDLATSGAQSLGKAIRALDLAADTITHIASLVSDGIIRSPDDGATYSFTHDIFFEWAYYRLLIGRGHDWAAALINAGEPPLLGRVVSLFAQYSIARGQAWEDGLAALTATDLRPQWRRAWLIGPPSSPDFASFKDRFQALLTKDDHALLRSFLVWFQAEQTMPSPLVLQNSNIQVEGAERLRAADLLGWPSDFATWTRVVDWLLSIVDTLPVPLLPHVLELFKVWQNVFSDLSNRVSNDILQRCAVWLADMESLEYRKEFSFDRGRWSALSSEARSAFESGLRQLILRATRTYRAGAEQLLDRSIANERLRRKTYDEIMAFSPTTSLFAPQKLADLARAELINLLPKQEIERERRSQKRASDMLARIHAKPEAERTDQEKRVLEHRSSFFATGAKEYDLDDLAIDKHHHSYFPVSPLHEPFASLFRVNPDVARVLVRDLANHATEAWRQVHALRPRRWGTPIPLDLEFPWGKQRFWGDWNTYNWIKGYHAPHSLTCALLALVYWAHKQLDSGRPTDDVIREVLEGHQSLAVVPLAAALALEKQHVSATVLPIATSQLIWKYDIARSVQEGTPDIDILGLGALTKLTGDKATADQYLKGRASRYRSIRDLAPLFALSSDEGLRSAYQAKLARFPDELPFDREEQRSNAEYAAELKETAEQWAGLGAAANYHARPAGDNRHVLVEYQSPTPLPPTAQERLQANTTSLTEYSIAGWANKSISASVLNPGYRLADVLKFVREREKPTTFRQLADAGSGMTQSAISGTAACVIHFGGETEADKAWAWKVMARVEKMHEVRDPFGGGNMPWHPAFHLIAVLAADLRKDAPRPDSASRLLGLALHPRDGVARAALNALLRGPDLSLAWIAAGLASDLFVHHMPVMRNDGSRDDSAGEASRKAALRKARRHLKARHPALLTPPPPPWRKGSRRRRPAQGDEDNWQLPDISFNSHLAEEIVPAFPVETFCQSPQHRSLFLTYIAQVIAWTDGYFNPGGRSSEDERHRQRERADLHLWPGRLAELLARVSPFIEFEVLRDEYLAPFCNPRDENGLAVMSEFAEAMVVRHLLDAATVTPHTLALLGLCLDQLLSNPVFERDRYRAGQVHGFDLPKLTKALLFLPLDLPAPGASRFANGDWTDLPTVLPLVTRLMEAVGWAPYVMGNFLTLCERAGSAYPINDFAPLMLKVLENLGQQADGWVGTLLPARIAGAVQLLADGNYPLPSPQATALLRILDRLIDLGDRRSAALQQSEAFRTVQVVLN